jgi:3-hydroxyisobutyrate dehydrogenase/glyoxylate/succinic semialdehyde reductase
MQIGFIGLGIMGSGMAHNLLRHDVALTVHNRTPQKAASLQQQSARWAETPGAVADNADIIFTMLAHPEAVREVALGPNGFLPHMPSGTLWVDCSTVHPRFSREMARVAADYGVHFVDAPVAGTKPQAEGGQLVFFAGGSGDDLAHIRPYLDMMGRAVVHVGAVGMGSSIKVVINALLASAMTSFAESVTLGLALGLAEERLFDILIGGPVTAPFLAMKRPMMAEDAYEPQFPLRWMRKDLQMAAEAALDVGMTLPLASAAETQYADAIAAGLGDLDFAAIYRHLKSESA